MGFERGPGLQVPLEGAVASADTVMTYGVAPAAASAVRSLPVCAASRFTNEREHAVSREGLLVNPPGLSVHFWMSFCRASGVTFSDWI
jgi:hypothetical protein